MSFENHLQSHLKLIFFTAQIQTRLPLDGIIKDKPDAEALFTTALDLVLPVGVPQNGDFGHICMFSMDSQMFL